MEARNADMACRISNSASHPMGQIRGLGDLLALALYPFMAFVAWLSKSK